MAEQPGFEEQLKQIFEVATEMNDNMASSPAMFRIPIVVEGLIRSVHESMFQDELQDIKVTDLALPEDRNALDIVTQVDALNFIYRITDTTTTIFAPESVLHLIRDPGLRETLQAGRKLSSQGGNKMLDEIGAVIADNNFQSICFPTDNYLVGFKVFLTALLQDRGFIPEPPRP